MKAGIAEDDLEHTAGCGVFPENRLDLLADGLEHWSRALANYLVDSVGTFEDSGIPARGGAIIRLHVETWVDRQLVRCVLFMLPRPETGRQEAWSGVAARLRITGE